MEPTTLTERCQDWNLQLSIDKENWLVRNIALVGGTSRNGYTYSESALRGSVQSYAGKPVFLDHSDNPNRPQERSTRDLVGSILNPVFVDGRIRGDIHVLKTESGKTFLNLLEIESPGIGMSHVVKARRSADGQQVEEIVEVISVDAVVNPATTSTFRESCKSSQLDVLQEKIQLLQADATRLQNENTRLNQQLVTLQSKSSVRDLMSEYRLPDRAVTDFFLHQLEEQSSDEVRRQMILDRLAIIDVHGRRHPLVNSQERNPQRLEERADDLFVNSLRRR